MASSRWELLHLQEKIDEGKSEKIFRKHNFCIVGKPEVIDGPRGRVLVSLMTGQVPG